jgi:hypothetical protein
MYPPSLFCHKTDLNNTSERRVRACEDSERASKSERIEASAASTHLRRSDRNASPHIAGMIWHTSDPVYTWQRPRARPKDGDK